MYTIIEYVIVHKANIYEVNDISHLNKGDKVMLNLHVFGKGRSTYFKPEFCVDGILLINKFQV